MSQNKPFKFEGEVDPKPHSRMSDPDAKRREELKGVWHNFLLNMYKILPYAITVFSFIFLLLLFFIIMPFSEMHLDSENWQQWMRDYSRAFITALGSFGVTVVAVLVSELLKYAYRLLKKTASTQDK